MKVKLMEEFIVYEIVGDDSLLRPYADERGLPMTNAGTGFLVAILEAVEPRVEFCVLHLPTYPVAVARLGCITAVQGKSFWRQDIEEYAASILAEVEPR